MTPPGKKELIRKIEAIYQIMMDKYICIWGHGTQHLLCDTTCHCLCKSNPQASSEYLRGFNDAKKKAMGICKELMQEVDDYHEVDYEAGQWDSCEKIIGRIEALKAEEKR